MLPSSSRVNLNRVALKDVIRLKVPPRRRRASESPDTVTADPRNQVDDAAFIQNSSKAARSLLSGRVGPEKATRGSSNLPEGLESCALTKKARKKLDEPRGVFKAEEQHIKDNKDSHPKLSGLADSERRLRRAVGASCCVLCSDSRRVSHLRRALGKGAQKSNRPGPERSVAEFKIKRENLFTEGSKKLNIWIGKWPKVTLCDVAQYCETCSHNCGFLLPHILETKVVGCFKQDMSAGFRFSPGCLGHDKSKSEGCAPGRNCKVSPRVKSEKYISQSLGENQGNMGQHPDVDTLSDHPKVWTTEANAANSRDYRTNMWDTVSKEENPGAELLRNKRVRFRKSINGSLPATPDIKTSHFNETAKICTCSNSGIAVKEKNCVHKKLCSQVGEPPETDAAQMEMEVSFQGSKVNTDDPETFTCQRVRAFFRSIKCSCARTYMPWPFSNHGCTLTPNASITDGSVGNQPGTLSSHSRSPTDAPAGLPRQASYQSSEEKQNRKDNACTFSCSPDSTEAEKLLSSQLSHTATPSTPSRCEPHSAAGSASSTPGNEPEDGGSMSTPFPLSDWEMSSLFTQAGFSNVSSTRSLSQMNKGTGVQLADAHSTSASPSSPQFMLSSVDQRPTFQMFYGSLHSSDSSQSCESSLLLPQDEQECEENVFSDRSTPELLISNHMEHCEESSSSEITIRPLLSPVHSPQRQSQTSPLPQRPEEVNQDLGKYQIISEKETRSGVGEMNDSDEEESQGEPDCEDHEGKGNGSSKHIPLGPKVKATCPSAVRAAPHSSPSSDKDDGDGSNDAGHEVTCSSKITGRAGDPAESAGDAHQGVLDEFTAYEQDILLVDLVQDDAELFKNLPEQSLLKLGPTFRPAAVVKTPSSRTCGASLALEQKVSPGIVNVDWDSPDITEEKDRRPWRPHSKKTQITYLATDKETRNMGQPDANNNHVSGGSERSQPIHTASSAHDTHPLMTASGSRISNLAEFRRQKSNAYCRHYFSESQSCGFKMCRFQHVPVDGDEKLCVETVIRFTKNPMCLQKAGAVFTGYYQNNSPGVYFSTPVLLSLLWALLKAGMIANVFSVLRISLAHKLVPNYEFLLALFNYVREKGLVGLVPELMQLTLQMASSGLVLSFDCLDSVKTTPECQHTVHPPSPASGFPIREPLPEYLNLAHSIVEIELCAKQEDWSRMGEVFTSMCQFSQHPNQVERISGRIAIALLSGSKDMLPLPFAAFAETVCQSKGNEGLSKSFLGRIGVSLMLRYHKTYQWAKGQRVVQALIMSKVDYSTLKGLFGNEDGASRCCLITVAAELFLMSGSVEGALNEFRENKWFLSSCMWPCEPADLESRTRVLTQMAVKTSHRDTLEILCNLPGIKEPIDMIDISMYSPCFNSHLQVCVDRQILPVATDTVEFMLSKKLPVDRSLLQTVLHKLGKQNLWLRAREIFRHSLSVGYYQSVSAPTGSMSLMVPCSLGEVELALAFEMFITVNATAILGLLDSNTQRLSITLKRTQSCESEYLSAGSRLLSAACIPQPKLTVHYRAVNSSQEQVFMLDTSSARQWFRCNHLWANEVWTQ